MTCFYFAFEMKSKSWRNKEFLTPDALPMILRSEAHLDAQGIGNALFGLKGHGNSPGTESVLAAHAPMILQSKAGRLALNPANFGKMLALTLRCRWLWL